MTYLEKYFDLRMRILEFNQHANGGYWRNHWLRLYDLCEKMDSKNQHNPKEIT